MTQLKLVNFVLLLGCLFIFSCKTDDDITAPFPVFTKQDMVFVHGGDSLTWKLTEFQNSDTASTLFTLSCMEDDLFTFYAGQEQADIALGDVSCSGDFTSQNDFGLRVYFEDFNDDTSSGSTGAIRAAFTLSYEWPFGTFVSEISDIFQLLEVSQDRMKFVDPELSNVILDDYKTYFVLERVR